MAANNNFNAFAYFEHLGKANKLAQEQGFITCYCSGPESIQGIMQNYRKSSNFIMIDDTTSQNTYSQGVTFFKKEIYTVFIVAGYKYDDMLDRQNKLTLCRRIFRQLHSRMIYDQEAQTFDDQLQYLDINNIFSTELGRYAYNGVTGLYFMVQNDEPTDLEYSEDDWNE